MKCTKCGTENENSATKCATCDKPINKEWDPFEAFDGKKGMLTIGDGFRLGIGLSLWGVVLGIIVYILLSLTGHPVHF